MFPPHAHNPAAGSHSAGHQMRAKHMAAHKKSLDELETFALKGMGGELKRSMGAASSIPGEAPSEEAMESPQEERLEENGVPTHAMASADLDTADHAAKHALTPPPRLGETPTEPQAKPDEHEALHSMLKAIHARKK